MLEIDGSSGEGGGQILRTSLTLALVTGRPFRLTRIRAGRSKPGLQAQHLTCVQAAARISGATVEGAVLGSQAIAFKPGPVTPGDYHFPIATAGACSLVLHAVYLPLALAHGPSTLRIVGGTHVSHSPSWHFLETTWLGYLRRLGLEIELTLDRPGFFPRGGGQVMARIAACPAISPWQGVEAGRVRAAEVLLATAGQARYFARSHAERLARKLKNGNLAVDIVEARWPGGPGSYLAATLATTPVPTVFFALEERGKPADVMADRLARETLDHLAGPANAVDPHSADQLLLPLALAKGKSSYAASQVTQHLLTNAAVVRRFVDRTIMVEGVEGEPGVVNVD